VDGGELQISLRAEQGVDAALCHSGGVGESADGETIESLDGRELCRALDDAGTSLVTRGACPLRRWWLCHGSASRDFPLILDRRSSNTFWTIVRPRSRHGARTRSHEGGLEGIGSGVGCSGPRVGVSVRALRTPG